MKIGIFSDTHTQHYYIKGISECDLLIFAGDCMGTGYNEDELENFLEWFNEQPSTYKIMVAGNHDRFIEDHPKDFRIMMRSYPGILYLDNQNTSIEGLQIYGTPYQRIFGGWAFNRSEDELERLFGDIPKDTDILVSHAPAYGVLDKFNGIHLGEKALGNRISSMSNLKLHVHGHIHGPGGTVEVGKHLTVNGAVVDDNYGLVRRPIYINL